MVGYIARTYKSLSKTNRKIKRISALDPALPLFYPKVIFFPQHIEADDADFVDVIHTDGGFYGVMESTGSVDFFPNGGTNQVGCDNNNKSTRKD
jgi:pancreatic triacylglycerol lipase